MAASVLELKNVEDRYVVPQLTRYYASLYKEQPFADKLDYGKPIRLLAISAVSFEMLNSGFCLMRVADTGNMYLQSARVQRASDESTTVCP